MMATLEELESAFLKAHNAGNREHAQAFATEIKRMRGEQPSAPATLGPSASFALPSSATGEPTSRADYYLNSLKRAGENLLGMGPMVADAARAIPSTLIPGAGALIPGGDLQSELQRGFRGLTGMDPNMQAPDALTRYGGKALEFGVTGLPFALRSVATQAHRLPAAIAELNSAAGGGIGHELGGDIGQAVAGDRGKQVGQFVGGLGGSFAGLAAPATFSKIWAMTPNFTQAGRDQAVQALAGRKLGGALEANPETAANMAQADDVINALQQKGAGIYRPTLAQSTGAEGVIAIEQQHAAKNPQNLGTYAQRERENRAVIDRARDIDFPQGGDFRRGAEQVTRNTITQLENRFDALTRQQEALTANIAGQGQQATGERLQALRDEAQKAARGVRDAKLQDVYATANRMNISEDMSDAVAIVRQVGGADANTYQNMPGVFQKVLREHAPKEPTGRYIPPDLMAEAGMMGSKPASFQEVHSLWRQTNTELSAANRIGDTNAVYYLNQLKNTLKAKLDKYEQAGQGELSDKFREFNKWYSEKYAPAFKEGVGGRMAAVNRYGDIVKPEQVVGKFFTPSGMDDFAAIYADNPQAQTALRDGILGLFSEKAVRGDRIDPRLAAAFIRQNAEALDKAPDIRALLSNTAATNEALLQRAERLTQAQADVSRSTVAKIANTDNPDALVQASLTDRSKMLSLISSATDASSRKSVLRSIADNIVPAAERSGLDPLQFIVRNEQALRPALNRLGSGHYENLKLLATAEMQMARTAAPSQSTTPRMTTSVEDITGSSPRTIWAQSANTTAGRQSPESAFLHLFSRWGIRFAEKQTDKVIAQVIYDPALTKKLVAAATQPMITVGQSNGIVEHLQNAGIRVLMVDE